MTPEKRLNQIEPELAEVIQKVDRLIESNGQILELAVNTKAELTEVKEIVGGLKDTVSTIETTIGDLKTDVSDLKTDVGDLKTDVGDLKTDVGDLKITVRNLEGTVWGLKEAVEKVEISGNSTARAVANLTVSTGHQFDELKASQVRLEETQQEILSFLRNKFN